MKYLNVSNILNVYFPIIFKEYFVNSFTRNKAIKPVRCERTMKHINLRMEMKTINIAVNLLMIKVDLKEEKPKRKRSRAGKNVNIELTVISSNKTVYNKTVSQVS